MRIGATAIALAAVLSGLSLAGCETFERIDDGECLWVRHGQQGWFIDCLDGSPAWPLGRQIKSVTTPH